MNNIKKADLNAPRFRKTNHRSFDQEFLNKVRERFPQYSHISDEEIKKIIYTFNENIFNEVINVRDGVEIPSQIGHLFIGTCPPSKKRANIDMKLSLEYMQKIKHRNFESDQHIAKIFFTTYGTKFRFKHHDLWAFNATRDFSRAVSASYPENWKKYLQVDPGIKISNAYKNQTYKMDLKIQNEKSLEDYNEFDL